LKSVFQRRFPIHMSAMNIWLAKINADRTSSVIARSDSQSHELPSKVPFGLSSSICGAKGLERSI